MFLKKQSITSGALVLSAASFLSYLLGLWRDRLFAGNFGAGETLDAYNSAFLIPDLIANLLFAGVSLAVLMPVLADIAAREKPEKAFRLASTILNLAALLMLVLAAIAFVLMPWLMQLIAPGFDAEQTALAVQLSRLMLLSPMLFMLSNALGSILVSMKRFVGYAFSPVFYNIGIVAGTFFFADAIGIYAAVLGTLFGALLHLLIRVFELIHTPFRYMPILDVFQPAIRKIVGLMIPRMIGLVAWQANLWAWTAIASTLAAGSIAIFSFSRNLQSLPVSLFGIALATAVFPTLSEMFAKKDWKSFTENIQQTSSRIFFFVLPASVGIFLLRREIVQVLLGTGDFTAEDVQKTAFALGAFCLVVPFESLVHLFTRAFYAQLDTKTPVVVSIVMGVINIGTGMFLVRSMGVAGLPLGFAIASAVQVCLLYGILHSRIPQLNLSIMKRAMGKTLLGTLIMAVMMGLLTSFMRGTALANIEYPNSGAIATMILGIPTGAIVYLITGFAMKNENMAVLRRFLPGR
ncbi:MAG: murein biosynthesis integral membrane protein MurJ [Patescibacteria group bacterium]|jgi:putative peptidoglycan lipid II flippase